MTVGFACNNLDIHLTNVYAPFGHAPWQVAARRSLVSFMDDHNTSNPHSITIGDFNQVLDVATDKVTINGGAPIGNQEDTTAVTTYCANGLLSDTHPSFRTPYSGPMMMTNMATIGNSFSRIDRAHHSQGLDDYV